MLMRDCGRVVHNPSLPLCIMSLRNEDAHWDRLHRQMEERAAHEDYVSQLENKKDEFGTLINDLDEVIDDASLPEIADARAILVRVRDISRRVSQAAADWGDVDVDPDVAEKLAAEFKTFAPKLSPVNGKFAAVDIAQLKSFMERCDDIHDELSRQYRSLTEDPYDGEIDALGI